jgi:hypothetical protein
MNQRNTLLSEYAYPYVRDGTQKLKNAFIRKDPFV